MRVLKNKKSICHKLMMDSYLRPTIRGIPEIITTPKAFDFPRLYPQNTFFIHAESPSVKSDKNPSFLDTRIYLNKKLIYCSLGNYAHLCKQAKKIYRCVIKAFAANKNVVVILALGARLKLDSVDQLPNNVYAFPSVDQLRVLHQASVMITHAGLNSVKECIQTHTPMLAIPFANDGFGNAARVVFHRLGIHLSRYYLTPKKIHRYTHQLLNEPIFQMALHRMSTEFKKEDDFHTLLNITSGHQYEQSI
jgi:MGT family glycosyltransferase